MKTIGCVVLAATIATSTGMSFGGDFLFFKSKDRRLDNPNLDLVVMPAFYQPPPAPAAEMNSAAAPLLLPAPPLPGAPLEPVPLAGPIGEASIPLYDRVKYEDLDNIHPCAVPMIVAVPHPCPKACACTGPQYVYVRVCMPPNCTPKIKYSRGGRKVDYDFGDYSVDIKSKKNGWVYVNYDD